MKDAGVAAAVIVAMLLGAGLWLGWRLSLPVAVEPPFTIAANRDVQFYEQATNIVLVGTGLAVVLLAVFALLLFRRRKK